LDHTGWGADEVALACASHGGEPEHVALAASMLSGVGFAERDLACGPHEPISARGSRLAREQGITVSRLHNNCSGKHAAMLAFAGVSGWSPDGYHRPDHPVQRRALASVARWTGQDPSAIQVVVDGCGVTAFALPLDAMAKAFAALARAALRGDDAPRRVLDAVRARPFLLGGTDLFDTVLAEESAGRIFSKIGAEGVHTLVAPEDGIAAAIKVADGASRAQFPAVVRLLQHCRLLPLELTPRLEAFLHQPTTNTRGEVIGHVRPAM
jgi:L-asparaginase II